jgi:Fe-S cluster assembly iron-binding protein IscA
MADECYVFSLFSGDASHLRQLIRQAKAMKIRVHVRMPGTAGSSGGTDYQSRLGADTFEAFA